MILLDHQKLIFASLLFILLIQYGGTASLKEPIRSGSSPAISPRVQTRNPVRKTSSLPGYRNTGSEVQKTGSGLDSKVVENNGETLWDIKDYLKKILDAITDHNRQSLIIQKRTLQVVSTLFQPSCQDLHETGNSPTSPKLPNKPSSLGSSSSEVAVILPPDSNPTKVRCESGWTVILSRATGTVLFNRTYAEYEVGFGDPAEEYYIGNAVLHALTTWKPHQLRVELEDFKGKQVWAEYLLFKVAGPEDSYRLTAKTFNRKSSAGDALVKHDGMKFSTYDSDSDNSMRDNCAIQMGGKGGWWYNRCYHALGTGVYRKSQGSTMGGIAWYPFHEVQHSLKLFKMMVKATN